jgi:hypothetical protein
VLCALPGRVLTGRSDAPGPIAGSSLHPVTRAMRAPPPVEFTSALGRAWRAALSLLVGAAVAVPLAWSLPYAAGGRDSGLFEVLGDPLAQAGLALGLAAMACAAFWRAGKRAAMRERTLRWDGQDWLLAGDASARPDQRGDAALMLDLGPWMLVRFVPHASGAATWLPLAVAGDRVRWAALRGALWNWRAGRGDARPWR